MVFFLNHMSSDAVISLWLIA